METQRRLSINIENPTSSKQLASDGNNVTKTDNFVKLSPLVASTRFQCVKTGSLLLLLLLLLFVCLFLVIVVVVVLNTVVIFSIAKLTWWKSSPQDWHVCKFPTSSYASVKFQPE